MEIITIPIGDLIPYENNPRMNDGAVNPLVKSIQDFGFKVPIIVDKNNIIICGHTRLKAAQKIGMKEVPCIIADDLTPEQVKAFRIADNKTSDFSMWDNKLLLQELKELEETDWFTGFDLDLSDFENTELLNESDNNVISDNEDGVIYEVVFKSENKEKIERIKKIWDGMQDEENPDSGDFWEETGDGETEAD